MELTTGPIYLWVYFEITNYHYIVGKIDTNSYNTINHINHTIKNIFYQHLLKEQRRRRNPSTFFAIRYFLVVSYVQLGEVKFLVIFFFFNSVTAEPAALPNV